MPLEYYEFAWKWISLNPGLVVDDFSENSKNLLRSQWPKVYEVIEDLYERDAGRQGIELYVQLADIMGYFLVWYEGGAYFNTDMEPVRSLPTLPDKAWASYENHEDGRIVNAAIGAPKPEDPFWTRVLEALPQNYWDRRLDEMVMSTGPGFLTEMAHQYPNLLHVFPVETFNPVHWKEIDPGGDASGREYPEGTIAVHHWGHKKDGRSNTIETATQ